MLAESLTKLDSDQKQHSANYTGGEKTGRSWTDRVMEVKGKGEGEGSQSSNAEPLPQDKLEGVDDDEWVSGCQYSLAGLMKNVGTLI